MVVAPLSAAAQAPTGEAPPSDAPPADVPPSSTPTPPPLPADSSAQARVEFRAGMAAFEAHEYHQAIAAFERAAALTPSADLWFNIARSYEELNEFEPAAEYYRRYLRDRVDPPDRARVEERIASLEERAEAARVAARQTPTTGTIRVDVDVPGATVSIDDREVGTSPVALPLTYPQGEHIVEVRMDGRIPFRARVRVDAGSNVVAVANLAHATEYRSIRGRRRVTWVMAGLAVASLGTSIGLGIHAYSLNRDGDRSGAARWGRYSDYAIGGVALFGIGTVTLYFGEGRAVRTERVEPR